MGTQGAIDRDDNATPGMGLYDSVTHKLVTAQAATTVTDPVTGVVYAPVQTAGGGGGGGGADTQYTDGQTPPTNPIGNAITFDNNGTWKDVGIDQPFPVQGTVTANIQHGNLVDATNSTTTLLGANGVFTGVSSSSLLYSAVAIEVYADQASATNGLQILQSQDGTHFDLVDSFSVAALTAFNTIVNLVGQYYQVKYTNGASAQGTFRLQVIRQAVENVMPRTLTPNGNMKVAIQENNALGSTQLVDSAGTNKAAIDTSGNLQVKGGFTELSGLSAAALNADLIASMDVSAYQWIALHLTGAYSATLQVMFSNDNINFSSVTVFAAAGGNYKSNITGNDIYQFPRYGRYMRVRLTGYTSGTVNSVAELYTTPPALFNSNVTAFASQSGTWTVQPGNTQNSTPWLTQDTGGPNFTPGQVSIATTATLIASARTNRKKLIITNIGTTVIYLGGSGVTASTGLYLAGVAGQTQTLDTTAAVYGIVGSGSQTISYAEEY